MFQAQEFFFFSGFLAVVMVVFAIMAYFYKYVNYGSSRGEEEYERLDGRTEDEVAFLQKNDDDDDDDDDDEKKKPKDDKEADKEEKTSEL